MKEIKRCCFTGYRPSKFPFPLIRDNIFYSEFENKLTDAIFTLADQGCYTFITGAAMGLDLIAAEIVLLLRSTFKRADIKLICAVPFANQSGTYDSDWKIRYDNVIKSADEVILISNSYFTGCYQKRNEFMVDNSDCVITWFSGKPGGTRNTLRYAKRKGLRIVNLNEIGVHDYLFDDDYETIEIEIDE